MNKLCWLIVMFFACGVCEGQNAINNLNGIPCLANKFWGVDYDSVYQYSINGSFVSYDSTLSIQSPAGNLIYCNNVNGGNFSPTFYASNGAYFDGTGWVNLPVLPTPLNGGGNGDFLYYMAAPFGIFATQIYFYNGVSTTLIYSTANINKRITVADIAVDDLGFAYFFTGIIDTALGLVITDSLHVISPSGQMIKEFAFNFLSEHAYGSFITNGIIYIGLGFFNPVYPNSLLPLTIVNDSVLAGSAIPMPVNYNSFDLAGCNAGLPLTVSKNYLVTDEFSIFPNPSKGNFTISFSDYINKGVIEIFNVYGEKVFQGYFFNESKKEINIKNISSGIYLIKVFDGEKSYCKKIIIE